jgi:hypothetical protein
MFLNYQVSAEDINHYQSHLEQTEAAALPGIMKAHHVFSHEGKLYYQPLSCHCSDPHKPCLSCHKPQVLAALTAPELIQPAPPSPPSSSAGLCSDLHVGDIVRVLVSTERGRLGMLQEIRPTRSVKLHYFSPCGRFRFNLPDTPEVDYFGQDEIVRVDIVHILTDRGVYKFAKNPLV